MQKHIPHDTHSLIQNALAQVRLDVRNSEHLPGQEARQAGYEHLLDLARRIKKDGPQIQHILLLDQPSEVEALGPAIAKWSMIALAKGLFELNEWARTGVIGVGRRASFSAAKHLIQLATASDLTLDFPDTGYDGAIKAALKEELKGKNVFGYWSIELVLKDGNVIAAKLTNHDLVLTFETELSGPYVFIDRTDLDKTLVCWVTKDSAAAWCLTWRDKFQQTANQQIMRAAKDISIANRLEFLSLEYTSKAE